jgi:hypothetical protein
MKPGFLAEGHSVMNRLPFLTFAGLALLLLAAAPVRANEAVAAAPDDTVAAPAEAVAAARRAGELHESPLVVDTPVWREPASSSRPAKRWSTSAELDSNSYRVSLSRGKLDLGMGFDASAGVATRTARNVDPAGPIVPTLPSLSIGLRSATGGAPANSLIERANSDGAANPSSTRRVGLEWKPAPSSVFVRGGLRLTGDDRVTMKVRSGRVGLYMKSTF